MRRWQKYGFKGYNKISIEGKDADNLIWLSFIHSLFYVRMNESSVVVTFSTSEGSLGCHEKILGTYPIQTKFSLSRKDLLAIVFDELQLPLKYHGNSLPYYWTDKNTTYIDYTGWLPDWSDERIARYGPEWETIAQNDQGFTVLYGQTGTSGLKGKTYYQNDYSLGYLLLQRDGDALYARRSPDIIIPGQPNSKHISGKWMFYQIETESSVPQLMSKDVSVQYIPLHQSLQRNFASIVEAVRVKENGCPKREMVQVDTWENVKDFIFGTFKLNTIF